MVEKKRIGDDAALGGHGPGAAGNSIVDPIDAGSLCAPFDQA